MESYNGENDYYPKNLGTISYEDGSKEYWKDFRTDILKVREKSEDDFEKYLNIFGSGGLLIGLTLLSKLVGSEIKYISQWMLIYGSALFVLCLLSNLLSHYLAVHHNDKNISDVDNRNTKLWVNFERRNRNLSHINKTSLGSIIVGSILITSFLILNINTMSDKNQKPVEKPKTSQSDPKPINEEKGRMTQTPSFQIKPKK